MMQCAIQLLLRAPNNLSQVEIDFSPAIRFGTAAPKSKSQVYFLLSVLELCCPPKRKSQSQNFTIQLLCGSIQVGCTMKKWRHYACKPLCMLSQQFDKPCQLHFTNQLMDASGCGVLAGWTMYWIVIVGWWVEVGGMGWGGSYLWPPSMWPHAVSSWKEKGLDPLATMLELCSILNRANEIVEIVTMTFLNDITSCIPSSIWKNYVVQKLRSFRQQRVSVYVVDLAINCN